MSETRESHQKKHDFFISYVWCTGFTIAKHLRENAHKIHRTAFLDKIDLKDVPEDTEEFRSQIDQAIDNSSNFILIMTRRFNESPEVIREYRRAEDSRVKIWRFKQKDLKKDDLLSEIDFSKKNYIEFTDEFNLLSKVDEALTHKLKPKTFFEDIVSQLIDNEGLQVKQTTEPLLEVIVAPTDETEEWLSVEDENLLNICPYGDNFSIIKARRKSFELESKSELTASRFLRVTTNGVFHLIEPIGHAELLWLNGIFNQIAEMLLYCATVMKQKKQNAQQSAYIQLINVHDAEVRISEHQLPYSKWSFARSDPKPFVIEFDLSGDWKEIGKILKIVFKDLCQDISFKIAPQFVNGRLTEILSTNFYVIPHGFNNIQIPAINIFDFGLFDKAK